MENIRRYIAEFIGAFVLMFTIACVILIPTSNVIGAIAIGFALMIMVYALSQVSGGHFNPAVSLAASIRGALSYKKLIPYMIFQIIGALLAACLALNMANGNNQGMLTFNIKNMMIAEFIFTFVLCYVVLMTATSYRVDGNSFYGLAIGSSVTTGIFAVGNLCFTAFNPAVAIGLGIIGIASWQLVCLTIVANILSAIAAALIFKLTMDD